MVRRPLLHLDRITALLVDGPNYESYEVNSTTRCRTYLRIQCTRRHHVQPDLLQTIEYRSYIAVQNVSLCGHIRATAIVPEFPCGYSHGFLKYNYTGAGSPVLERRIVAGSFVTASVVGWTWGFVLRESPSGLLRASGAGGPSCKTETWSS